MTMRSGASSARPEAGAPVVLDQVLWRDLVAAATPQAFGAAWLGLVSRLVAGASDGLLLLALEIGAAPVKLAVWPTHTVDDLGLLASATLAIKEARGLVQPADEHAPMRLAYPVQVDDRVVGAVALSSSGVEPRDAMRQLQWSVAWLRDYVRRHRANALERQMRRSGLALELLAAALEEERFVSACRVAATELTIKLDCQRVAFGFLRHHRTKIVCISHSAQFGKRMKLIRQLAAVMDEAIDQQATILFPPEKEAHLPLSRSHAALARGEGAAFIFTVPMFVKDRFVGAVTFERGAGASFDQSTLDVAEAVASILGPALVDKRDNDRWIVFKVLDATAAVLGKFLGPGHLVRKLALIVLVAVAAFFYFATAEYEIVASGEVEGALRRSLSAPFDGFIGEAPARAGDIVRKGQLLAALDNRDLTLERLRWVTERQQHMFEYDQALGKRERADSLKFQSLVTQADAQIHLSDEQLSRARILAPFDGLVVSGDLTQSIGAAVHRGDVMFEIAPMSGYRIEMRVNESQIADVLAGQTGELVVSALPDISFPFRIERITPIARVRDGGTFFQVDGRLERVSSRLRPGMEGVGRIRAGSRRVVWIWFRSFLHWARVTSWKWFP